MGDIDPSVSNLRGGSMSLAGSVSRRARVLGAIVAACATLVGGVAAPAAVAADDAAQQTFTAEPLPTWQTNGVVYAVERVGNVIYAGGNFTAVRPPGSALGQNEVPRKNIAAFDATTGDLLPFSHNFTSFDTPIPPSGVYDKTCSPSTRAGYYTCDTVYEIRASRDGSRIYVGGDFVRVDGADRQRLAAFGTGNGALLPWRVSTVNGRVRSLAVSPDTVFVGGSFTAVNGSTRTRLAAVDAGTGALRAWSPSADALVLALAMAPDDSRVILGGQFDRVNGVDIRGLAAVDAATGTLTRWDSRPIPRLSTSRYSYVTDLAVDEDTVYASANGEGGGVFDGRLAADPYTGELRWVDTCLGATWSIEVVGDLVYSGSHAHDCRNTPGGFPEIWNVPPPLVPRHNRLLAQQKGGAEAMTIEHWFPTTNGGIVGQLGPRDMASTGDQLWVAGEFTTVNGRSQWGLTRFGLPPTATSHTPVRPAQPSAVSVRPGEVRVSWPATEDFDDERLTYTVLRGRTTGAMAPIGTIEADSKPWYRPTIAFTDSGLEPGESWVYQVIAADPSGRTSPRSWDASVTVAGAVRPYPSRILADGASLYWRLDDAAGATRATSLAGSWGTYRTGVTAGIAGALPNVDPQSTAVATNASGAGVVGSDELGPGPQTFSAEAWFRTTSGSGGKLLGFGNSALGTSSSYDRHVYLLRSGQLSFGVFSGSARVVTSPQAYNDGRWHHVVATLGAGGQRLYVDGRLVAQNAAVTSAQAYSGHWRLGGDNLDGWPSAGNRWFNGQLDEFAVYPSQLSAATIAAHHALDAPDTQAPSTPTGLSVAVSGTAVSLSWSEATDNVAVSGYEVHRSAVPGFTPSTATRVATVTGASSTEEDVPPGTWYYRVVASDSAGNRSAPSAQVAAVVEQPPVEPVTLTLAPAADAWVDSTAPSTNRGNAWGLSSDGVPEQSAYLRFDLPEAPAGTTLRGATLRLTTTASTWSGSASEHSVSLTDGSAWTETGLTFQNRPAVAGSPIGAVAAGSTSDTTYEVDLSLAQLQARLGAAATLVLSTPGGDAIQVSSKEQPAVASRPQLILDFS
jgi:hypothetical protein